MQRGVDVQMICNEYMLSVVMVVYCLAWVCVCENV